MADERANPFNNSNSSNNTENSQQTSFNSSEIEYLKHIDDTLNKILKHASTMSQSAASDNMQSKSEFRNRRRDNQNNTWAKRGRKGSSFSQFTDAFEDAIVEGLVGSDFKDNIKKSMNDLADMIGVEVEDIPETFGKELGKQAMAAFKNTKMGQDLSSKLDKWQSDMANKAQANFQSGFERYWQNKNNRTDEEERVRQANAAKTKSGTSTSSNFKDDVKQAAEDAVKDKVKNKSASSASKGAAEDAAEDAAKQAKDTASKGFSWDSFKDTANKFASSAKDTAASLGKAAKESGPSGFMSQASSMLGGSIDDIASKFFAAGESGTMAGAALSGISAAAAPFIAQLGVGTIALTLLDTAVDVVAKVLKWTFAPALESGAEFLNELSKSASRYDDERQKMVELGNERFYNDVKSMIEEPFNILEDAANEVYNAWDNVVREINGTQGYTKDDLQSLLGSYSQRLREEGLSSAVSSVDIIESLTKVLDSGLSGKAAEEFAYLATILNAAIPNQDFFGYADEYASIVANATAQGQSQAEALEYANEQLESFASNVLYSSRVLTNGVTTGLQDAENLFSQSVKIAQAAGTNNSTQISSLMTTVAAVVGSVAPDLSTAITDMIYKAATGGNSSEIVALRSLAGINASNTEFLKALSEDPQSVFYDLFNSLGNMQKMSEDNYMEVAEGLSNIFGVQMDAFTRIDFNKLADAISQMNTSNASLEENLSLLASGETTTTKEQQVISQINEYLIDEGLAYVLDNEVARAVQQHMWDEQIAQDLMDAEYAVNLKGDALEFLEGIRRTISNVLKILTPWTAVTSALSGITKTAVDSMNYTDDIGELLDAGKVGTGNLQDYYNLTTRGRDLDLVDDIVTIYKGSNHQVLGLVSDINNVLGSLSNLGAAVSASQDRNTAMVQAISDSLAASRENQGPASKYSWGSAVGKSISSYLSSTQAGGSLLSRPVDDTSTSAQNQALANVQAKIDKMLDEDYINKFVEEGKGYDEWASSAKNFGIADLSKALEDVGYSEESVKARFDSAEAGYNANKTLERYSKEEEFWENTQEYLRTLNDQIDEMIELTEYANQTLDSIYVKESQFYDAWVDYFVKHTAYSAAYDHTEVSKVQKAEQGKSQDAVYALAEALTKNSVDLLDPTIQTNALLSQILIVVNAIMQQNNKVESGTSLPDTLSALAMGLVKST